VSKTRQERFELLYSHVESNVVGSAAYLTGTESIYSLQYQCSVTYTWGSNILDFRGTYIQHPLT